MRGVRIGSVLGIPVRLDLTFLVVLPLFAYFIGTDVTALAGVINDAFGTTLPAERLGRPPLRWVLGLAAALGLFVGILLHEFGHSVVAMWYGYEIDSITLWLFGGVARFADMPDDWRHEAVIAVAGPVVSVAVGVVSYVGLFLVPGSPSLGFVLGYLAVANVALAVFNMLPGFPMDGGRVLRALLARDQPYARATRQAAEVGKAFAVLLAIFGLFANPFLVALALFVYIGAASEAQQTEMRAAFEDVTVADVMTPRDRLATVGAEETVESLLDRMFRERHTGYPVLRSGDLVGMVTLDDASGVPEVERDALLVDDVMSDDLTSVAPDDDVVDAIEAMHRTGVGRLPVVEDGRLVGLVSRTDVMTALEILRNRGTLDRPPTRPSVFDSR